MQRIIASLSLVLAVLLMGLGFSAPRTQDASKVVKTVPARSYNGTSGQDLFREYCAVCHGADGRGGGPAATALKTEPSDLTRIARDNSGKFPEIRVQNIISGDGDHHGVREMPEWGHIFRHTGPSHEMANVRVYNLMKYIEELQEK